MGLYPEAPKSLGPKVPADSDEIAKRILEGMETGQITLPFTTVVYGNTYTLPGFSRGDFLGPCLILPDVGGESRGSDDTATFMKVWNEIMAEKLVLATINPNDSATEEEYVAALQNKARHLDPQKWADGRLLAEEVTDFSALKAKLSGGP